MKPLAIVEAPLQGLSERPRIAGRHDQAIVRGDQFGRARLVVTQTDGLDTMTLKCETAVRDAALADAIRASIQAVAKLKGEVELVYPPISFLAEPQVAVVTKNAEHKGTLEAAKAYLEFLYTPEGQEIIAKNFYRPTNAEVLAKHAATFPQMQLFRITAVAKSWDDSSAKYFGDGGLFDTFYKPKR